MDLIVPVAPPPSPCHTEEEDWGSKTLLHRLAQQLQLYKPHRVLLDDHEVDQGNNDEEEQIGSNCGIRNYMRTTSQEFSNCVNWRKRRAAVLICLFEGPQGELRVILTKRSMKLASHPGDVALPGGKMEERDVDDSATALREAMEEIGLDPALVQVLANLEPFLSQHLLKVIPVIGLVARIQDFKPLLNTDEVDAIFDVPLEMFLKEENHRIEEREWMGWKYGLHLFEYESEQGEYMICGLTAAILIRVASLIYQRSPSFQPSLPDFQTIARSSLN
ncbi:hypothetical protein FEM48_Zijuj11G0114400 [Ziziphus jujuba var. spinosa]|uniref:Nudix hydrolase domain-containing protein n=1 Tax=Ziziphus jujuba var. spinosa TaxID=714518 RepID=A0A978UIN9_ZIZJJ|nr:hypothetical protein FEM48_Zijuj11G0114400 [Ziziphus jujuba var. spinosa]